MAALKGSSLTVVWICPDCRTVYRVSAPTCERDGAPLAQVFAHQTRGRFPLLGKVVGDRYRLIGGLGKGGLGTVYLAEHQHLGHLFAIKFLEQSEEDTTDQARKERERHRRDFLKEARVASLIRHPSVVGVTDFGEHEGMPFLVMDYVPGPSLLQEMERKGRFTYQEACDIARRIAEALDAFHDRRLVHRDLKPANVILDPREDGRLTLVDLGLVKDLAGPGGKDSTHPLALRGTPGYLAPEQVPGWVLQGAGVRSVKKDKQPVDPRVDIYALGVIFYEMIAGEPPYPDGSNTQVIVYACTKDPPPLHSLTPPIDHVVEADPPVGLEKLVLDTMARDRERRPASAAAFIERLQETMTALQASEAGHIVAEPATSIPGTLPPGRVALPSGETLPDDSLDQEYDTVVFDTHDRGHHEADHGAYDLEDSLDEEAVTVAGPMPEMLAEARSAHADLHHSPGQVPPGRRPTAETRGEQSRGMGLWLGLLGVCLAAGAGAWWALQSGDEGVSRQQIGGEEPLPTAALPDPQRPDPQQPTAQGIGQPISQDAAVDAEAIVFEELAADASLEDAEIEADAEAKAPEAGDPEAGDPEISARPKRRRRRAAPRPAPTPPATGPSDLDILTALLREGDTALKRESYQRALRNYRKFLARAPQDHAKYFQVQQRVRTLEQLTAFDP